MRIAPDIYMVASGNLGCSMTDDIDCNCYLFDSGEGFVLFDSGGGRNVAQIFAQMEEDGLSQARITHTFLTHCHADHSGGAHGIKDKCDCQILCGSLTARQIAGGDDGISLNAARKAGVYPSDYRYSAPMPDRTVEPGSPLRIGRLTVTPIFTPGHSLDHMCYLVETPDRRSLLSGDALFHSGRIVYQTTDDFDISRSCRAIEQMGRLEFDVLLPGHGMFVLKNGRRHANLAIASIKKMKPPAGLDIAH